ncbi:c-type cytochrome [Helicobacter canadensis]|uniref:Cytochrome c family protein n=1 Tax=Helicobacter canadensis MIT 98-5491 TaxID=537970 RepID=C5ZYF5_9HELI|nr:c-type cytochrome [Helicobacter canadensis]EES90173.1 cytochrome c family protein [Helicobacter canadensis MIT 98-5491]EFR49329.1 cytochrome C-553 [Helicobacter canadensis MIT 98-5491]STP02321.1 cytochrome c553 [Helicobacter canadensis]
MKKILLSLVLATGCLMAADGATLYKKCIACHGMNGERVAPGSKGNVKIGGMDKAELVTQLKGYAAGTADNGGAKQIMYANMKNFKFTDADIDAVADYISKLPKN